MKELHDFKEWWDMEYQRGLVEGRKQGMMQSFQDPKDKDMIYPIDTFTSSGFKAGFEEEFKKYFK